MAPTTLFAIGVFTVVLLAVRVRLGSGGYASTGGAATIRRTSSFGTRLQRDVGATQPATSATSPEAGDLFDRFDGARDGRFGRDLVPRGTFAAALKLRKRRCRDRALEDR